MIVRRPAAPAPPQRIEAAEPPRLLRAPPAPPSPRSPAPPAASERSPPRPPRGRPRAGCGRRSSASRAAAHGAEADRQPVDRAGAHQRQHLARLAPTSVISRPRTKSPRASSRISCHTPIGAAGSCWNSMRTPRAPRFASDRARKAPGIITSRFEVGLAEHATRNRGSVPSASTSGQRRVARTSSRSR